MSKQQGNASQHARKVPHLIYESDSPCSTDADTQVIADSAQRDMGALSIGDSSPMLLSPGQTLRELAQKLASKQTATPGSSDSILLRPGQTAWELAQKLAAKQRKLCVNCQTHPADSSHSVSGHSDWCEYCDTSAWVASICSYCSVRPVATDSLCGMHMCDACDITMWVVRTEQQDDN